MADQPDSTMSNINYILAIWAVLAPVAATVITAWWNRKNELENREYNQKREDDIYKRQKIEKNTQIEIDERKSEINEIKKTVINFISFAVECQNSMITSSQKIDINEISKLIKDDSGQINDISGIVEQHSKRIQKLSNSFNNLFLLSPPKEILESSENLLNFISKKQPEEYQRGGAQQLSEQFRDLKTNVLNHAQNFVKKERDNISNLIIKSQ